MKLRRTADQEDLSLVPQESWINTGPIPRPAAYLRLMAHRKRGFFGLREGGDRAPFHPDHREYLRALNSRREPSGGNRLAQMVENPQPIRNREEKKGAGGVEDHAHRPPCRICRKPGPRGRAACRSKIRTSLKSGETPYIPYRSAFQQPELHPLAPPCTTLRKIHRKVCGGPFSFLSARFLFPEVFSELLHGLSEFLPLPFFEGILGLLE